MNNQEQKTQACCLTCAIAKLLQYGNDPVLAQCTAQPQPGNERFPYRVEVASFVRQCKTYTFQPNKDKPVEHREKRIISSVKPSCTPAAFSTSPATTIAA